MTDGPNHNVFDGDVSDSSSNDPRFSDAEEPATLVISELGRELLRINIVDGKMDAVFDPENLTEAAKIFIDECKKYAG